MGNVAIDIGKKRSYLVVEQDGEIVRGVYVWNGPLFLESLSAL